MDSKIKLLIADSNTRWTKAIQEYLIDNQEIEFVGAYADGSSAWNAITESKPNVIIINMILPVIDGLGIIENIAIAIYIENRKTLVILRKYNIIVKTKNIISKFENIKFNFCNHLGCIECIHSCAITHNLS